MNTKPDLIAWFLQSFETVNREKAAGGYVNVPRTMGLVAVKNGKFLLTPAGKQFFTTQDTGFLYDTFAENVFGVEDIVEFLRTADEPQTEESILEFLKENLDVEWTTFAQVNFRL